MEDWRVIMPALEGHRADRLDEWQRSAMVGWLFTGGGKFSDYIGKLGLVADKKSKAKSQQQAIETMMRMQNGII